MLEALFSFKGRFNRLQYLGWTFVSIFAVVVMTVGIVAVLAMVSASARSSAAAGFSDPTAIWRLVIIGVFACIVLLWPSLAITAKRLRDIGLPPLICILGLTAFQIFDWAVLTHVFPDTHILSGPKAVHHQTGTIAGVIVSWCSALILLLVPGRAGDNSDDTEDSYVPDTAERDRRRAAARAYLAAETSRTSPPLPAPTGFARAPSAPSGPPVFGRRH